MPMPMPTGGRIQVNPTISFQLLFPTSCTPTDKNLLALIGKCKKSRPGMIPDKPITEKCKNHFNGSRDFPHPDLAVFGEVATHQR